MYLVEGYLHFPYDVSGWEAEIRSRVRAYNLILRSLSFGNRSTLTVQSKTYKPDHVRTDLQDLGLDLRARLRCKIEIVADVAELGEKQTSVYHIGQQEQLFT